MIEAAYCDTCRKITEDENLVKINPGKPFRIPGSNVVINSHPVYYCIGCFKKLKREQKEIKTN